MKRIFLLTILAVLFAIFLAGCRVDPNVVIIGHWECQDDTQDHIFLCSLTFDNIGRFTDADGDSGAFIISGNMLHLDFDDYGRTSVNFTITGRRLTITQGDDVNIRLAKQ